MTKTVLTQFIELINKIGTENPYLSMVQMNFMLAIREEAEKLLPLEREQIANAFSHGIDDKWSDNDHIQIYEMEELHNNGQSVTSEYFNRNFEQYTPPVQDKG